MAVHVELMKSTLLVPDVRLRALWEEAPFDAALLARAVLRGADGRVQEVVAEALEEDGELTQVWDILADLATAGELVARVRWVDGPHGGDECVVVRPGDWEIRV